MLIRSSTWDAIREHFSQADKLALRKCLTGETICPRGFIIDEKNLSEINPALLDRLHTALRKLSVQ